MLVTQMGRKDEKPSHGGGADSKVSVGGVRIL